MPGRSRRDTQADENHSACPAITPAELQATPEAAQELIENQVWPEVEREFRRLRANPGLIAAVLAGLSAAGGGVAYQQAHKKPKRKLPKVKLPKRKKNKNPFKR